MYCDSSQVGQIPTAATLADDGAADLSPNDHLPILISLVAELFKVFGRGATQHISHGSSDEYSISSSVDLVRCMRKAGLFR